MQTGGRVRPAPLADRVTCRQGQGARAAPTPRARSRRESSCESAKGYFFPITFLPTPVLITFLLKNKEAFDMVISPLNVLNGQNLWDSNRYI